MRLQHKINFLGVSTEEAGDVATQDGEIIGAWSLINDAIYDFTPESGDKPIYSDPFIWALCDKIREWLEQQAADSH